MMAQGPLHLFLFLFALLLGAHFQEVENGDVEHDQDDNQNFHFQGVFPPLQNEFSLYYKRNFVI